MSSIESTAAIKCILGKLGKFRSRFVFLRRVIWVLIFFGDATLNIAYTSSCCSHYGNYLHWILRSTQWLYSVLLYCFYERITNSLEIYKYEIEVVYFDNLQWFHFLKRITKFDTVCRFISSARIHRQYINLIRSLIMCESWNFDRSTWNDIKIFCPWRRRLWTKIQKTLTFYLLSFTTFCFYTFLSFSPLFSPL